MRGRAVQFLFQKYINWIGGSDFCMWL